MSNLGIDTGPPEGLRPRHTARVVRKPKGPLAYFIQGAMWTIGAFFALVLLLILHPGNPANEAPQPVPQPQFQPGPLFADRHEAAKAASLFERLLTTASPDAWSVLAFITVDATDYHLVIHWRPAYQIRTTDEDRRFIEEKTAMIWRDTKYVREWGWSGQVEFAEDQTRP